MRKTIVVWLVAGAFLVLATAALAGKGASGGQYLGVGGQTQTRVTPPKPKSGTLPFTGLNLVYLVGGSAVLLGTGLVLRRRNRRTDAR